MPPGAQRVKFVFYFVFVVRYVSSPILHDAILRPVILYLFNLLVYVLPRPNPLDRPVHRCATEAYVSGRLG